MCIQRKKRSHRGVRPRLSSWGGTGWEGVTVKYEAGDVSSTIILEIRDLIFFFEV